MRWPPPASAASRAAWWGTRRVRGRPSRRGLDVEGPRWGYGTEVSALSFGDNLVEATLSPGRVGDPRSWTWPGRRCLAVTSTVETAPEAPAPPAGRDRSGGGHPRAGLGTNEVRLSAACRSAAAWDGTLAVVDPPLRGAGVRRRLQSRASG